MLQFLDQNDDAFLRTNKTAHMTASAWVLSPDRTRVVMCYHNIYNSWSWTGGHADGNRDLVSVAIREVLEETGLKTHLLKEGVFSLEILNVDGHMKNGVPVSAHQHMNVTYLLQAEEESLRTCFGENSGVKWMTPEEAMKSSSEPWMVENVYRKLADRARKYMK